MLPPLLRWGLALLGLGLAFIGALLVLAQLPGGVGLIVAGLLGGGLAALGGDLIGRAGAGTTMAERLRAVRRSLRPWTVLLALFVLLKVPVPLWPDGFPLLATLSTVCLSGAALLYSWERVGAARAASMALLAFLAGLGVELLGSRTGWPFGLYSYAGAPGLTLLGVPLLVPLGWFGMTLAASLLAGGRTWLCGALLVAWDLGLEPLMTQQGFWRWQDPAGLWAGAPLANFTGWFVVGVALSFCFQMIAPPLYRPGPAGGRPLALAYLLEAAFLPAGLLLLGQPVAALVCLVAMGGMASLAWWVRPREQAWTSSRRV
ncbi:carotenoid biosynthesis protein [Deinococcus sonorensis]|uniref:Carotenoid biosynthesis protein n=2 Tax=Deinococcus sonorensis TaxID=309891 RepID=A0AAU7UE99_9DEIO